MWPETKFNRRHIQLPLRRGWTPQGAGSILFLCLFQHGNLSITVRVSNQTNMACGGLPWAPKAIKGGYCITTWVFSSFPGKLISGWILSWEHCQKESVNGESSLCCRPKISATNKQKENVRQVVLLHLDIAHCLLLLYATLFLWLGSGCLVSWFQDPYQIVALILSQWH